MAVYGIVSGLGRRVVRYAANAAADYAYRGAKRRISGYFNTPTPKRMRMTPVSQRTHITNTPSPRFSPRRSRRTLAMTNLRRRLQRTPRRVRMRRGRGGYGASSSKSSGFIRTPARVRYGGVNKSTNLGVVTTIETGGVLDAGANSATAGNTVAVGHCQFPPELAHHMFWRAIVKKLAVKLNMPVFNFDDNLVLSAGANWYVNYRLRPTQNYVQYTYTAAGSVSLETVSTDLHNFFRNLDDTSDLELQQIGYTNPTVAGAVLPYSAGVLDLANASFVIFAKSTLKVQNRTVQDATDDEESVDNVPIYGKAYYGKGSGSSGITRDVVTGLAAAGFWCDGQNGTLSKVPTEKWYQEVVQPSHFRQVMSAGKVHLDPGHIKTSVLDGKITVSLNKIYRMLFRTEDDILLTHEKAILGRFRFMLLEKMINAVAGSADNGIKVAFEHNLRIGGYIKTKRRTETAQLNSVANIRVVN